ncbi:MAG: hypothetical protein LC655_08650, partial [Bacteroidales bacterium]|nr:hypothetical protein [Bacteroidales bacterium]
VKHYQNLHIVYGKPIEVSEYWDEFEENGPRGMNLLKQRLADDLKPLMINIETEEYYDMYLGLRTVFNDRMREIMGIEGERLHDKFLADKEMIRRLDEFLIEDQQLVNLSTESEQQQVSGIQTKASGQSNELTEEQKQSDEELKGKQPAARGVQQESTQSDEMLREDHPAAGRVLQASQQTDGGLKIQHKVDGELEKKSQLFDPLREKVERYMKSLEKLNIRDWVVKAEGYSTARTLWRWFTLLLTLPVFLYGFINNALMYFLPVRAVRNIKDVQFHSSVKAGLGMVVLLPLTYLLQTLLVAIFTDGWYIWVAYLVLLFPAGKLALLWYLRLKKTLRGGWFGRQYRRNKKAATELVQQRREIIDITEKLIG